MNAVEMIDIVKEYPGVLANDHVTLVVREGEIHGLVGENGAGKSTIMNQLYACKDQPPVRSRYLETRFRFIRQRTPLHWESEWFISILCWHRPSR